ncbi:hypothetical protein [Herbidospora cretacea]|uniref:hypothetical protein n=1 Tax=Herbidospora cretacea TaxID=28444 RepID=UPI000773D012|nr:hypothetical protein [Herbidospora cretacea]
MSTQNVLVTGDAGCTGAVSADFSDRSACKDTMARVLEATAEIVACLVRERLAGACISALGRVDREWIDERATNDGVTPMTDAEWAWLSGP